jgi:endonuclease YncB( thermonuclease family)
MEMTMIRRAICAFLLVALPSAVEAAERWIGSCLQVVDGDTIAVDREGAAVAVHLDGVDAPEPNQDFADQASAFLADLLEGKTVAVEPVRELPSGAVVARVLLDEMDVNHELVVRGLAWHDTVHNSDDALVIAMFKARSAGTGLWADPEPMAPWKWRERHRPPTPTPKPKTLAGVARQVELSRGAAGKTVIDQPTLSSGMAEPEDEQEGFDEGAELCCCLFQETSSTGTIERSWYEWAERENCFAPDGATGRNAIFARGCAEYERLCRYADDGAKDEPTE